MASSIILESDLDTVNELVSSMPSIEFQMSLLLFIALAGYLIAFRINQSAVVGIILAGIVMGPSLFGWITYTDFVAGLAHMGAVILLFTIGLEFDVRDIMKMKYLWIALVGILVPWFSGFGIALLFSYDFNASVFIGTTLCATSIAITANILRETGKLQTPAAKAVIGAAVIDDVLALLALSVSEGIISNSFSAVSLIIVAAKAVGFILISILVGRYLVSRLLTRLDDTRFVARYPESMFIFTLMVAFLYAILAELVGLSAIVGAFLAGVTFTQINLKRGHIFREGCQYLQFIFASIFFLSLGIMMNLQQMTINSIWFILALTGVAIISKVIGCGLPAKLQGMNTQDSLIVGFGMVPRGEVAMIVALIGLNKNLISQTTYDALILMSLLTTIIFPMIFKKLLSIKRKPIEKTVSG